MRYGLEEKAANEQSRARVYASHGIRRYIHIHPASSLITRSSGAYEELAAKSEFIHHHRHINRRKLLRQLTRYDYGWAGLNGARNREHLEIALPNKVIEYVACGLPVLAFPHEAIEYFIERNGVGIVGENVGDLARQLGEVDLSEFRWNLEKCRQGVIIEEKIGQLIDFYR